MVYEEGGIEMRPAGILLLVVVGLVVCGVVAGALAGDIPARDIRISVRLGDPDGVEFSVPWHGDVSGSHGRSQASTADHSVQITTDLMGQIFSVSIMRSYGAAYQIVGTDACRTWREDSRKRQAYD